jgi:NTE family protein
MDITLALGGGGAKGHAHVGVIRTLEREGVRVRGVAGTSFGGLIAVLYALGFSPDAIEDMFASVDQSQFYGHAPNDGPSLMGLAGVTRLLEDRIGDRTFADLKLPCVITAADLKVAVKSFIKGSSCRRHACDHCDAWSFPARYIDGPRTG